MLSDAAKGYTYAIVQTSARCYRLFTNRKLSDHLFKKLYNRPHSDRVRRYYRSNFAPEGPRPTAQNPIPPSCDTPQVWGATAKDEGTVVATVAPAVSKSPKDRIAELAPDMGAKKIRATLLAEGIDMPLTTVKRRMREARK